MSENINMETNLDAGYSVKRIAGCRIVFGPIPLADFGMLTHGFSKKAVMAADIADRIGATLVVGEPEDIEALRRMNLPVSAQRQANYLAAKERGLNDVADWLRDGEHGESSRAMCKRIFGLPADAGADHPHDPDDLRRCLQFLAATGARDQVALMRDVSPAWDRLVSAWDAITQEFDREKTTGTCSRTSALMQEALADRPEKEGRK